MTGAGNTGLPGYGGIQPGIHIQRERHHGGSLEFGLVQSDVQYEAVKGLRRWAEKAPEELRSVFSIHRESVCLVAAVDAGINTIADLKGKGSTSAIRAPDNTRMPSMP